MISDRLKDLSLPPGDKKYLVSRFVLLTAGALLGAVGVVVFLLPHQIAPSGVSGIGVILNHLTGIPVGLVIVAGNIPIQILAYRELFGWRAVLPTVFAVVVYSLAIDLLPVASRWDSVSDDLLLNAVFGGLVSGFGGGLIYRAGGSLGGTSTLARILRKRFGLALNTSSLFTDVFVLAGAGLVFGWEAALYALVALFVNRSVSDNVLDGSGQSYTALIISAEADTVAQAINSILHHRVTIWGVGSTYDGAEYDLLMVSISRPEMHGLRQLVERVDTEAYMTILEAHVTYGEEFQSVASRLPFRFDEVDDSVVRRVRQHDVEETAS